MKCGPILHADACRFRFSLARMQALEMGVGVNVHTGTAWNSVSPELTIIAFASG